MSDPVNLEAVRLALHAHPDRALDHPADVRRRAAVDACNRAIDALEVIENERLPITDWERYHLDTAVRYVRLGLYNAAIDRAEEALIPVEQRTTTVPGMPPFAMDQVRQNLAFAERECPTIELYQVSGPPPTFKEKVVSLLRDGWDMLRSR